jgi:predicted ATPase
MMRLQIKNFQMIENADIQFEGLTVIAGENDTGKTTIGKILFAEIRNTLLKTHPQKTNNIELLLKNEEIRFPVFIDNPDLLSKFNYLKNTMALSQQYQLNFLLPDEVGDLILRLSQPKTLTRRDKKFQQIKKLIKGEIYYDSLEDNIFYKKAGLKNKLNMNHTANGIKMFGFLQILILNGTLKKGCTLIFDEPEIHLHPSWQLEYAKMICEVATEGIQVLVNSHSPYMIEALALYAKKAHLNSHFYLANKRHETSHIENVSDNLERIYEKLAEPIGVLEELDDAD